MFIRQIGEPPPNHVPAMTLTEPHLIGVIERARLQYVDGQAFDLPPESSQMNYYADRTLAADGRSLSELIQSARMPAPVLDKTLRQTIPVRPPVQITPPDKYFFPGGVLNCVEIELVGRMARGVQGNVRIETSMFRSPVIYTNAITQETTEYSLEQLPLNTDPVRVGRFYFSVHPLMYYHCAAVDGDLITWELVESFQCSQLIRVTITQKKKYAVFYIPVSDRRIIERLRGRLADYRAIKRRDGVGSPVS
jgi:hypothetical protein